MAELLIGGMWWLLAASIVSGAVSLHFWFTAFTSGSYPISLDGLGVNEPEEEATTEYSWLPPARKLLLPFWLSFTSFISFILFAVGLLLNLFG